MLFYAMPLSDILLKEHQRTVNRVAWHPVESNQLLSGSHDGTAKLHVCLISPLFLCWILYPLAAFIMFLFNILSISSFL